MWRRSACSAAQRWSRTSRRCSGCATSSKRAPPGVTARELVEEFCGGMADGHKFKGYLPGGASGGILPEKMADLPLDFGTLEQYGCFVGSHAVVILSDKDDM